MAPSYLAASRVGVASLWAYVGTPDWGARMVSDCFTMVSLMLKGPNDFEESMLNSFDQDVQKGDFVVQIVRNANGVTKRIGVVLGFVRVTVKLKEPIKHGIGGPQWTVEETHVRVAFYDPDSDTSCTESQVTIDFLVKVDPATLDQHVVVPALGFALDRGRAKL